MSNKIKGEIDLDLDGSVYQLKFDLNRLVALEDHMGVPIGEVFGEGKTGIKTIRDSIWVGIKGERKKLTPDDVGEMMDPTKFEYYATTVARAVGAAMGQVEDVDKADDAGPSPQKKEGEKPVALAGKK